MRAVFAWIAIASAAMAQTPTPGVPPGWSVYVVHAPWCAPCQRFRRDYDTITQFRSQLETAFAVKSAEWDRPSEQRWARRFGAMSLPSFVVFRDGIHQQTFSGYDGDWRGFLSRLNLDPDIGDDRAGRDAGPPGQAPARPITPEERALPEISALQAELQALRDQMQDLRSATTIPPPAAISPAVGPADDGMHLQGNTSRAAPRGRIAAEQDGAALSPRDTQPVVDSGTAAGLGGSWGAVAKTLGTAALAVLAPQVVLPTGVLGAAITVAQILRRRRQAAQPQQPSRPWTVERPVVVSTDCPPSPAKVVTQNQYVPLERDTHQEAWAWASREYAHKYPGSEGMIQALDHLMGQYNSAKQKAA